jgi:hypothetical protein
VAWLVILQFVFQALAMWIMYVYLRKLASEKKKTFANVREREKYTCERESVLYGLNLTLSLYYYLVASCLPIMISAAPHIIIWFIAAPLPLLLLIVPILSILKVQNAARKRDMKQCLEKQLYTGIWKYTENSYKGNTRTDFLTVYLVFNPIWYFLYAIVFDNFSDYGPVMLSLFAVMFLVVLYKDILRYRSLKRISQKRYAVKYYSLFESNITGTDGYGDSTWEMKLSCGLLLSLFMAGLGILFTHDFTDWIKATAPCAAMTGIWVPYLAITRKKFRRLRKLVESKKPKEQS